MKNILLLCFLVITINLQAQITFTNYTTDDGLINNSVNCLAVDANDALWFGTQEGLSHFDGITWTNYNTSSHPDLVDNNITALFVDKDNNLWIGSDFGVSKFDGTNWLTYTETDGLADDRVKYFWQNGDDKIWIANNDGVSIFDGGTDWNSLVMADGIPFGGTNFIIGGPGDKVLLGTPLAGMLLVDGTGMTAITEDDGLLSNKLRSIAVAANGDIWIGTGDGISVFNQNYEFVTHHEIIFEIPPPDELNPVEDIQIGVDGRVWVGVYVDYLVTEGGISKFEDATWEDYDVEDGLIGPVVRRLAIDGANNVWVATSTGISKIGGFPLTTFDVEVNNAIQINPNPTSGILSLDVPTDLVGTNFQIYNGVGQTLLEGEIVNENALLNISTLTNGLYFLSINKVYNRKIILGK